MVQAACKQAWQDLQQRFAPHCPLFRATACALATLDCLQALASAAQGTGYCRPHFLGEQGQGAHAWLALSNTATSCTLWPPGISSAFEFRHQLVLLAGSVTCSALCAAGSNCICRLASPQMCASCPAGELHIKQGRAPLLDALLPGGAVPNDADLGGDGLKAMVISGPNMGGKSSFMCQVRTTRDLCVHGRTNDVWFLQGAASLCTC